MKQKDLLIEQAITKLKQKAHEQKTHAQRLSNEKAKFFQSSTVEVSYDIEASNQWADRILGQLIPALYKIQKDQPISYDEYENLIFDIAIVDEQNPQLLDLIKSYEHVDVASSDLSNS